MDGATPFFSLTSSVFPASHSLQSLVKIPLSITLHPLAQSELPHTSYGTEAVVRCHNCNGYVNLFTPFTQDGHAWMCTLCSAQNQVPEYFYAPLSAEGRRSDADSRAELHELTYDILAPEDYMLRPPMPPTFCFVVDISQASRACGMLDSVCEVIEALLETSAFPGLPRTQIVVILFGHEVHLLSFKGEDEPASIYSVGRATDEIFLPVPKDLLLASVADNEKALRGALQAIRKLSAHSCLESSALRLALSYAKVLLSDRGGKVLVFLGESNAEDSLQLRTDTPVNSPATFYRELAVTLTAHTVSCDLFVAASRFCSLYSMGDLAKYTSGKVFFYPELKSTQRAKLKSELWAHLTRETLWDASLRMRVNRDWKPLQVYGHYHIRTSDLLSLPTLDSAQTITYDLALSATLASSPYLHMQAALLYTTADGDRRIRVMNCRLKLADQASEIYRFADAECVAGVWAKQGLMRLLVSGNFDAAKEYLQQQLRALSFSYSPISAYIGHPLQFLPALVLGYMKLPVFNGQVCGYHLDFDAACWQRYLLSYQSPHALSLLAYPRLYPVHELPGELLPVALTKSSLAASGLFLLDSGCDLHLWIGHAADGALLSALFGHDFERMLHPTEASFVQSEQTATLEAFIETLRLEIDFHQLLRVVKSGDALESLLLIRMVEDETRLGPSLATLRTQVEERADSH